MKTFILVGLASVSLFAREAGCRYTPLPSGLEVREGYVQFIPTTKLNSILAALPKVSDSEIQSVLNSKDTIWYDESSIVFTYQDSVESVVGGRANCVARMVGDANAGNTIGQLRNYFGPDFRFKFPFRKAAGTDNVNEASEYVINFWMPPRPGGSVMPVKYWRPNSRTHWYWTFPNGTVFGEILFQKDAAGKLFPFEVRTRKRYREGWSVNLFRPFATAEELATSIIAKRPQWQSSSNLVQVINHLRNPATLVAKTWTSEAYGKVFPPISGYLDLVPDIQDKALVTELLTQTLFISTEGKAWKRNGTQETYGPASLGDFSIVPKGYEMGLIPVNEVSCNRCHNEVSRKIKHFNFDVQLYGEVWGEDRIFTWHLFEPHERIYNTYDDADNSRTLNPKLVQARLIKNEKPTSADPDYKPLPSAFDLN